VLAVPTDEPDVPSTLLAKKATARVSALLGLLGNYAVSISTGYLRIVWIKVILAKKTERPDSQIYYRV
jgi:hypothetical protein